MAKITLNGVDALTESGGTVTVAAGTNLVLGTNSVPSAAIQDDAVTQAKMADNSVGTAELADNITLSGSYVKIPSVTTTQRDALTPATGMLIYNSTLGTIQSYAETWTSIQAPPTITSISPTTADASGDNIVITGTNFSTSVTVKFIGKDFTQHSPAATTRNSATQITVQRGGGPTIANEPYDIQVTNSSGLTATLHRALDAGGTPSWTSYLASLTGEGQETSGKVATVKDVTGWTYDKLEASTTPAGPVTYSVVGTDNWAARSITLAADGTISGNPTDETLGHTTYTNTVRATDDAGNYTDQSLNIMVKRAMDGSSAARAGYTCWHIKNSQWPDATDGLYYLSPWDKNPAATGNKAGPGGSNQFYCDMTTDGGGWTMIMQTNWASQPHTSNDSYDVFSSGTNVSGWSSIIGQSPDTANSSYFGHVIDWNGFQYRNAGFDNSGTKDFMIQRRIHGGGFDRNSDNVAMWYNVHWLSKNTAQSSLRTSGGGGAWGYWDTQSPMKWGDGTVRSPDNTYFVMTSCLNDNSTCDNWHTTHVHSINNGGYEHTTATSGRIWGYSFGNGADPSNYSYSGWAGSDYSWEEGRSSATVNSTGAGYKNTAYSYWVRNKGTWGDEY